MDNWEDELKLTNKQKSRIRGPKLDISILYLTGFLDSIFPFRQVEGIRKFEDGKLSKLLADFVCDSRENFSLLSNLGIIPAIKPRKFNFCPRVEKS